MELQDLRKLRALRMAEAQLLGLEGVEVRDAESPAEDFSIYQDGRKILSVEVKASNEGLQVLQRQGIVTKSLTPDNPTGIPNRSGILLPGGIPKLMMVLDNQFQPEGYFGIVDSRGPHDIHKLAGDALQTTISKLVAR